jgi:hypothetical protein
VAFVVRAHAWATSAPSRTGRVLVATQAALAVGLACGAVLMAQSLRRLSLTDPGIDTDRLTEVAVSLPAVRYGTPASQRAYLANALEQLRAVRDVTGVTTSGMPLMLASEMNGLPRFEGEPPSGVSRTWSSPQEGRSALEHQDPAKPLKTKRALYSADQRPTALQAGVTCL